MSKYIEREYVHLSQYRIKERAFHAWIQMRYLHRELGHIKMLARGMILKLKLFICL